MPPRGGREVATPEVVLATMMRRHGDSGVQTHLRTFHEYLRSAARRAEVVTPFDEPAPFRTPVFGARLVLSRLSPTAGVWWYRHWHRHYLERALHARLATSNHAVVVAQCPVAAAAALAARTRQPVVMVAHLNVSQADEWADKGEISREGRLFRAIRRFEEQTLPRLSGVAYVSAYTRSVLEERIPALRALPGVVVPNGVVEGAESSSEEPIADLVTVGGLEPRKNQAYLLAVLAAAARLGRRHTLSVIGDGPDRSALEELAQRLGLQGQVQFLGRRDDPRGLVRRHRLYCHAALTESFGIVLIEAMAEGVPVLAGAVGGIPEVVRAGLDGELWPLDDPERAARVLVDLLDDEPRLRSMGRAGRERVRERFTPERTGARLAAFLDDVAATTQSAGQWPPRHTAR